MGVLKSECARFVKGGGGGRRGREERVKWGKVGEGTGNILVGTGKRERERERETEVNVLFSTHLHLTFYFKNIDE